MNFNQAPLLCIKVKFKLQHQLREREREEKKILGCKYRMKLNWV